jgi:hypothetical protein
MKDKVSLKWSKKENDWLMKYPNNAGKGVGGTFFNMIRKLEEFMSKDWEGKPTGFTSLRQYLGDSGFDPDTFTISVQVKTDKP